MTLGIYPPPYGIRGVNNAYYHQQSQLMVDGSRAFLKGVVERRGSSATNDAKEVAFVRDRLSPLRMLKTASADAQKIPEDRREYLLPASSWKFCKRPPLRCRNSCSKTKMAEISRAS